MARTRQKPVLLPTSTHSQAGVSLRPSAVLQAVELLKLTKPVEIKWAQGTRTRGRHRFRQGTHIITLSTYWDAVQVSKTLWHELIHAAQVERLGWEEYCRKYRMYSGWGYSASYVVNPFEVQARKGAELGHRKVVLTNGIDVQDALQELIDS